jgi:hypothetical protein
MRVLLRWADAVDEDQDGEFARGMGLCHAALRKKEMPGAVQAPGKRTLQ